MQSLKDWFLRFLDPVIFLTILGVSTSAFIWIGAISSRVDAVEARQDRQGAVIADIAKDKADIENLKGAVARIDTNVSWIIQQMLLRQDLGKLN